MELLRCAARESSTTVLVVAHDARLIPYANRVFHMSDGRLVESAEYETLDEISENGYVHDGLLSERITLT